ncbi:sensor histidine kinase [Occultella gossypii]|uniref:histidine kinase n=1 Tax=Occultella gossypii TaxID=2800820 RepID=A0ABS7S3I8_9MICO|nr:sensor histidine kinase [Occultella gossypii]MBZ2194910.1 sensor histidine kinase [Occultella gossypii]
MQKRSEARSGDSDQQTLTDAVLAGGVALAVGVVIAADLQQTGPAGPDAYIFPLGFGALMLIRRRFPRTVLILTVLGISAYYALQYPPVGIALPTAAALYSAAELGRAGSAWAAAAFLVVGSSYFRIRDDQPAAYVFSYELLTNVALMAVAIALGANVRMRREARRQQERLDAMSSLERTRLAELQVREERLQLARDLHDAVGHTMSVISVQSNVAADAIGRRDDDGAAKAVEQIRSTASATMKELRSTVDLLRSPRQGPLRTTGGLTGVGKLVESARDAGVEVDLQMSVDPERLSSSVDTAAYRIVQEALTNVVRHSGGTKATMRVDLTDGLLTIEIVDNGRGVDPTEDPTGASGHGLVGMRERAAALGGRLHAAGVPGGGFAVRAELPMGSEG